MPEIIHGYFVEICAFVTLIVWGIRLESKIIELEKKEIENLKLLKKLSEIAERLSFIEGSLNGRHRDPLS